MDSSPARSRTRTRESQSQRKRLQQQEHAHSLSSPLCPIIVRPQPRTEQALLRHPLSCTRIPAQRGRCLNAPLLQRLVIGAVPLLGNRCQPPLLSGRLEAQPTVSEFLRYRSARTLPDATSALQTTSLFHRSRLISSVRAPVDEATFRRRRMHEPHIPLFSLSILERPVSHRCSCAIIRRSAPWESVVTSLPSEIQRPAVHSWRARRRWRSRRSRPNSQLLDRRGDLVKIVRP